MSSPVSPVESGAILHALAGAISDVVVVLDRDGRYLHIVNRRAELLVKPADELQGRRVEDVFPRAAADLFMGWIHQVLDTGRRLEDEYEAEIGGRPLWFAAVVAPLSETTVLWIARDITERKALEAQLRQATKMEAVGRLAGGVAHDFNNLLTAISTNAYLALNSAANAQDVREELGQIKRAADRAAELTRQLLAFSRQQMLQPRVLLLQEAVREASTLLHRVLGEDIELVSCLDADTWPVIADAGQLSQVVMNLAVNARDAMPNGGTLTITAGNLAVTDQLAARQSGVRAGEYVVLTMRDTGTGMDQGTQERIFEPFFTTKERGKGTGLGLATVYGIVKQSNGHIQVASAPGRGTAFWIFLPRATGDATPTRDAEPRSPARARAGMTVLIVEDEPQVRGAAARVLRRYGYTVLECQNGLEALSVWAERGHDIALIVSDVVMPQMGGRDMVRRLRDDGVTIPVLFISGYAEGAAPERMDSGRSAFLAKPFDIGVFVRIVGELIEGGPSRHAGSQSALRRTGE
jgi:PAS domain S-box-containing protein